LLTARHLDDPARCALQKFSPAFSLAPRTFRAQKRPGIDKPSYTRVQYRKFV